MPFRKKSSVVKNGFIPTQDIKSSKQLSNNDKVCGIFGIKGYKFNGKSTETTCDVKPVCCNLIDKINPKVTCVQDSSKEGLTLEGFLDNMKKFQNKPGRITKEALDIQGCFGIPDKSDYNIVTAYNYNGNCNVPGTVLGHTSPSDDLKALCNRTKEINIQISGIASDNKVTVDLNKCKLGDTKASFWCVYPDGDIPKTLELSLVKP